MNQELKTENSIARANKVGPMRFWSYMGLASELNDYANFFTVLNNIVDDSQESGRFVSSVDAHTRAHVSVTDLPHF